jgi:hypothetical protein
MNIAAELFEQFEKINKHEIMHDLTENKGLSKFNGLLNNKYGNIFINGIILVVVLYIGAQILSSFLKIQYIVILGFILSYLLTKQNIMIPVL